VPAATAGGRVMVSQSEGRRTATMMRLLAICICLSCLAGAANAGDVATLGYSEDTVILGGPGDQCAGRPIYNHDYSLENGYNWHNMGTQPPYYGCFGEAFDVGPATVECGLYWFTQIGYYDNAPMDAYVWEGGVTGTPGEVLCVVPGITGLDVAMWPSCSLHEIEIGCCVSGEFTVGYWPDFYHAPAEWFCCADENGPGGFPWTCIAPGIGYETGWHHVNVVFPDCVSMGIGGTITEVPSPVESVSWGAIRSLFHR